MGMKSTLRESSFRDTSSAKGMRDLPGVVARKSKKRALPTARISPQLMVSDEHAVRHAVLCVASLSVPTEGLGRRLRSLHTKGVLGAMLKKELSSVSAEVRDAYAEGAICGAWAVFADPYSAQVLPVTGRNA